MVVMPQIGRKLAHKRAQKTRTIIPLANGPSPGALAALMQAFREEAARMTPEQVVAEDAAYAKLIGSSAFSIPLSGLNMFEAFVL